MLLYFRVLIFGPEVCLKLISNTNLMNMIKSVLLVLISVLNRWLQLYLCKKICKTLFTLSALCLSVVKTYLISLHQIINQVF